MLRGSKELECLFAQLFVVGVTAALLCTDRGSANGGLSNFIILNTLGFIPNSRHVLLEPGIIRNTLNRYPANVVNMVSS